MLIEHRFLWGCNIGSYIEKAERQRVRRPSAFLQAIY